MIIGQITESLFARLAADVEDIGGEDEGGWGDNDLKLDDEDDMGDEFKDADADSNAKGDGWAAEDDIEISQDMEATPVKEDPGEGQDDRYFVAPVGGGPPGTETERL